MNSSQDLVIRVGTSQLSKHGEPICGDSIEVVSTDDSAVIVLSDGLGSGIKANILSTMSVKMASTMLVKGRPVDEVMEAMTKTLPVCQVRRLAYSTLSILQVRDRGIYLAEYDNPKAFVGNVEGNRSISRKGRDVGEREIWESQFQMEDGDWIVMVSDGVLHAGIGGIWNLGWGRERVGAFIQKVLRAHPDAQDAADEIADVTEKLYAGKPGDDASIVVVRARRRQYLTVMMGPPRNREKDTMVVHHLMAGPGRKVVAGGTTGNIVARVLDRKFEVDLASDCNGIPPVAELSGVDLVTEGVLTLNRVCFLLKSKVRSRNLYGKRDGASRLAEMLLGSDDITLLVGQAVNPAHLGSGIPVALALKPQLTEDLIGQLRERGKKVRVEYF